MFIPAFLKGITSINPDFDRNLQELEPDEKKRALLREIIYHIVRNTITYSGMIEIPELSSDNFIQLVSNLIKQDDTFHFSIRHCEVPRDISLNILPEKPQISFDAERNMKKGRLYGMKTPSLYIGCVIPNEGEEPVFYTFSPTIPDIGDTE